MVRFITILGFVFLSSGLFAQLSELAKYNTAMNPPTTEKPFATDLGARSAWFAGDLDKDGKADFLLTDYSNNGRAHMAELTSTGVLEIVWSSPILTGASGSTPRWVRSGDLDGDGNEEIIFPVLAVNQLQVWEWDGADNSFGTEPALILDPTQFVAEGATAFRLNREVATVYDFDNDGFDELIFHTTGQKNNVYVLGVTGDFPGFAGWVLEGGHPTTQPYNGSQFAGGSYWHSIPADINGDGKIEIVNHTYNFYGFWSIEPTGADTYLYPDATMENKYREYATDDVVAYMGIQRADVDGDGKDEIAGVQYTGYDVVLVSLDKDSDPLNGWMEGKYGIIGPDLWRDYTYKGIGWAQNQFWGCAAADLNGNGRDEILLGGTEGYNVVSLEYNGTGSILDSLNYTAKIIYTNAEPLTWYSVTINDSAGVVDSVFEEAPFVSKMVAGFDSDNDGNKEVLLSYQSVYDSTICTYNRFDGSAWIEDSVVTRFNPYQINCRLLEVTSTGVEATNLNVVTPDDYIIKQNYPNPFNPSTSIEFALPVDKNLSIKVFDLLGKEVTTLISNQEFKKGTYKVSWDGKDNFNNPVAAGNYVCTLSYGNYSKSIKMTLLK